MQPPLACLRKKFRFLMLLNDMAHAIIQSYGQRICTVVALEYYLGKEDENETV